MTLPVIAPNLLLKEDVSMSITKLGWKKIVKLVVNRALGWLQFSELGANANRFRVIVAEEKKAEAKVPKLVIKND